MDKKTSLTLTRRILDRLQSSSRRIDSETYVYFLDCLSQMIAEGAEDSSDVLDELRDYAYAARSYDHAGSLEGFDIGACWGMLKLHDACTSATEEAAERQRQQSAVNRHKDILLAMSREPGITQAELAKRTGNSRSNLSQILARLKPYRLFLTSAEGRNKHYSLTTHGEELLGKAPRKRPWNNEAPTEGDRVRFVAQRYEYTEGEVDPVTGMAKVNQNYGVGIVSFYSEGDEIGRRAVDGREPNVRKALRSMDSETSLAGLVNSNRSMPSEPSLARL